MTTSQPECTWSCITPDPDIAGIGVTAAFIITSGLTLGCSITSVLFNLHASDRNVDRWLAEQARRVSSWIFECGSGTQERRQSQRQGQRRCRTQPDNQDSTPPVQQAVARKARLRVLRNLFFPIIFSLSDTQLVTGLAILVVGWIQIPLGLSVYHFTIIADLAWLASNTQLVAFFSMRIQLDGGSGPDKIPYTFWVSKALRSICMFSFFVMLFVVSTIQGHREWYDSFGYPVQCLIAELRDGGGAVIGGVPRRWMVANYGMLVWGYGTVFVRLFVTDRYAAKGRRPATVAAEGGDRAGGPTNLKGMDVVFGSLLPRVDSLSHLASSLFGVVWDILDSMVFDVAFTSAWFGVGVWTLASDRRFGRKEFCVDDVGAEGRWGFGQLVPLLMLLIPLLVISDAYGKVLADVRTRREGPFDADLEAGVELQPQGPMR